MEKRKPHYALEEVKAVLGRVETLRMTGSARRGAFSLGLGLREVVMVVCGLSRKDFYKSMTTYRDSSIWQDVYRTRFGEIDLYVKVTVDAGGHLLISFKEL